jgi:hypothetical protein
MKEPPMPSENWFVEFLQSVSGGLKQPPSESLPSEVAQVDDAARALLSQGDRLLISPTFRLLVEAAKDQGRRQYEVELRVELEEIRKRLDQADAQSRMKDLQILGLQQELKLKELQMSLVRQSGDAAVVIAQIAASNESKQQQSLLAGEALRAKSTTDAALISAGLPLLAELFKRG